MRKKLSGELAAHVLVSERRKALMANDLGDYALLDWYR